MGIELGHKYSLTIINLQTDIKSARMCLINKKFRGFNVFCKLKL